jgi:hypothetical protein
MEFYFVQENLLLNVSGGEVTTAAIFSVTVDHRQCPAEKYFVDGRVCSSYTFSFSISFSKMRQRDEVFKYSQMLTL